MIEQNDQVNAEAYNKHYIVMSPISWSGLSLENSENPPKEISLMSTEVWLKTDPPEGTLGKWLVKLINGAIGYIDEVGNIGRSENLEGHEWHPRFYTLPYKVIADTPWQNGPHRPGIFGTLVSGDKIWLRFHKISDNDKRAAG